MANSIEARFTGDLDRALEGYASNVRQKVLFSGVYAMARVIYAEVQLNASPPRMGFQTGNLQRSVYHVFSPERSTDDRKTYRISWNKRIAPHGHLLEFGTSRAPAYPFVRPAFDHMSRAVQAGKDRMTQRLEQGVS